MALWNATLMVHIIKAMRSGDYATAAFLETLFL